MVPNSLAGGGTVASAAEPTSVAAVSSERPPMESSSWTRLTEDELVERLARMTLADQKPDFESVAVLTTSEDPARAPESPGVGDPRVVPGVAEARQAGGLPEDEWGAKLLDLKGVARPPTFNGEERSWPEFRFKFLSVMELMGAGAWMRAAASLRRPIAMSECSPEIAAKSRLLYMVLIQVCTGKPLTILRLVTEANGLEAWRLIVAEYEPATATRFAAMLTALLSPQWPDDAAGFMVSLMTWERAVAEYEVASGQPLPADIRRAVVPRRAPSVIRSFLRVLPDECATYQAMRAAIANFIARGRYYGVEGSPTPMDVGALGPPGRLGLLRRRRAVDVALGAVMGDRRARDLDY